MAAPANFQGNAEGSSGCARSTDGNAAICELASVRAGTYPLGSSARTRNGGGVATRMAIGEGAATGVVGAAVAIGGGANLAAAVVEGTVGKGGGTVCAGIDGNGVALTGVDTSTAGGTAGATTGGFPTTTAGGSTTTGSGVTAANAGAGPVGAMGGVARGTAAARATVVDDAAERLGTVVIGGAGEGV